MLQQVNANAHLIVAWEAAVRGKFVTVTPLSALVNVRQTAVERAVEQQLATWRAVVVYVRPTVVGPAQGTKLVTRMPVPAFVKTRLRATTSTTVTVRV